MMPNEELDKTIKVSSLDDLLANNDIETLEDEEEIESDKKIEELKKKKSLKKWWNNLSKKKKIILIVSIIILIIAIILCVVFLLKDNKEEITEIPEEDVIVELENYRYENGSLIFLNENSEEIGSYECTNKDEELCYVAYYSLEDNFDTSKKEYEDGTSILERTPIINDTYVFISDVKSSDDETIKIYNIKENKELDETYRLVKKADSNDELFILKNNMSSYGIIKLSDTEENIIDFKYDYLGYSGMEGRYVAKSSGRNLIIDSTGKSLSKGFSDDIVGFNNKYIKTKSKDLVYTVSDYNGTSIYSDYDYIDLYDDYVFLIKDNKLVVKDYENNKYNEEEINLTSNDYIKVSIYDENNKLVETKESYSVEETDNNINISITKNSEIKTISLNKLEANVSKNTKYINYFDGILYIYSDLDKTNLLGTYTCTNANNLTTNPNSLVNCTITKDTVFEENDVESAGYNSVIPVINERFVFITDNPDLVSDSTQNIILYDLKKGTSVSKYSAVNTYSYTGLDELSFKSINENYVVCKNQSGKFGVVKIGTTEVTASIPFSYNSLEKIGDYYEASDSSGYYLMSLSGEKLMKSVPNKIKNYNDDYVTVTDANNYYIYDYEGNKITNTGYYYIALYDTYFAGVDKNNKLNLYYYSDPTTPLLESDIALNLQNYFGKGMVSFRISSIGKNVTIEVGTTTNTYDIYTYNLGKEETE